MAVRPIAPHIAASGIRDPPVGCRTTISPGVLRFAY